MTVPHRDRIYLSPPNVGPEEIAAVTAALESGWVSPLGPEVDAFEQDLVAFTGAKYAVALSSGTAGLHLALLALGVGPGDEVVVPTMTFGATAFAVTYTGASPVFLDIEERTWNLDPSLLEEFLQQRAQVNKLPAAIITVDLFGRPCDYDVIQEIAARYEVPLVDDAAEALGSKYKGKQLGTFATSTIFSFNGNKIITTSGGGVLVTDDESIAEKVRYWATQSREPLPWYEHKEIGFNYRMSNILASLGRVQLSRLPEIIEKRSQTHQLYTQNFAATDVIKIVQDTEWMNSNFWLATVRIASQKALHLNLEILENLNTFNVETRPVWKPMHLQPVFVDADRVLTGVSEQIFADSLCLPSGPSLKSEDVDFIADLILKYSA